MSGVLFPKTEKGDRSTTAFNKNVYSEMAQALGQPTLAKAIVRERLEAWIQQASLQPV